MPLFDANQGSPTCDDDTVIAKDEAYVTSKNTPVLLAPLMNDVVDDGTGVPPSNDDKNNGVDPLLPGSPDLDALEPVLNPHGLSIVDPLLFAGRHGDCAFFEAGDGTRSTAVLRYVPAEDFYGTDTCVYKACDDKVPTPNCDIATVTITVSPSPDDPVANVDAVETPKDTPVDVFPLDNDEALEDHPLVVTQIADGESGRHGECVVVSDTVILYIPDPGYVGLDECGYRACDDRGKCDQATIEIKVTGEADEPCDDKDANTDDKDPNATKTPEVSDVETTHALDFSPANTQ